MDRSTLKPATELARTSAVRHPNESAEYRRAREPLLAEEIELRRHIERVAELRRSLPPGGEVTKTYSFDGENGKASLADLFGDKQTLIIYSYMFGPQREKPCPMCTSFMGTWETKLQDIERRISRRLRRALADRAADRGEEGARLDPAPDLFGRPGRLHARLCQRDRCGHAGLQRVHAPRRRDPSFLVRRDGTVDRRSRPGSARCAGFRSALDHPRHDARRPRQGLVSEPQLLMRETL